MHYTAFRKLRQFFNGNNPSAIIAACEIANSISHLNASSMKP